jgi:DNA-binding CsgD family transcriptional regulator
MELKKRMESIIELASQGYTDKEIAEKLKISEYSINAYWRRMREKLGTLNKKMSIIAYQRMIIDKKNEELARLKKNYGNSITEKQNDFDGVVSMRPFGLAKGKITISEDFDAPLPQEVLELFGEHETAS